MLGFKRNSWRFCSGIYGWFDSDYADIDRIDYLARDSKNAGVSYGHVETERLIKSIYPILVSDEELLKGGIFFESKYVNTIDHFIFNLYQMYTHVYLHKTNIRIEVEFKRLASLSNNIKKIVNYDWYKQATDERFLMDLENDIRDEIENVFSRRLKDDENKCIKKLTKRSDGSISKLLKDGWEDVSNEITPRKILKEDNNIYLLEEEIDNRYSFLNWINNSIIEKIKDEKYQPSFWWKNLTFQKKFSKLKNKFETKLKKAG